ncbi:MAG: hypothetical protein NTY36_13435 [Deltaproteobacteria bacterium]|nr:hypothetical protein [Deltaproteobacteria bacterium]
MWQRFFQAFLMALLLLGGAAWAQGRDDLQDQGQQQPLQTDMVNKDQQSLDLSIDRHNSKAKDTKAKAKDRKAARVTDIKKSTESGSPKAESFKPSSRQYGMSNAQSKGAQFGTSGRGLIGKGYNQSSISGSTSFLDGYLLKSLHDEGISRKKTRNAEKPKDDLRLKGKTSF